MIYPSNFFITSGKGQSSHELVAFDNGLIDAHIANYNLSKVSSILPAGAVRAEKVGLREGSLLLTAYATISSNHPGTRIATAVGVGIPCSSEEVGVIMEFSGYCSAEEASARIKSMCTEAMQNHGIPCKEVLISAIDAVVEDNGYTSLISALSFW